MRVFGYRIVFVPGSYVGFYVWWSARGVLWSTQGDDGRQHVAMVPVMVTGFGQFLSDLVETWPVRGGCCGGCRGVVGDRGRSLWAEHCPFLGQVRSMLLPVELGGWIRPVRSLMSVGPQGLSSGRR